MKSIIVKNISKIYKIKKTLDDGSFREIISNPLRLFTKKNNEENFYALKNVSFDLEQGNVLGIIGKNGAGKSTLLKILSRITYPTSGTIKVNGKIASLLEVGTGFHHELTGRENIFVSGVILGMTNKKIRKAFDSIVDFAGVEKFLDTPVKRYSSGMQLRLAFAVAANLDPEVLVIDEVLAVGDLEFQKKCLKVMDSFGKSGRTVLFVSHNMAAIKRLCNKCMLLSKGKMIKIGDTNNIIDYYISKDRKVKSSFTNTKESSELDDDVIKILSVKASNESGNYKETFNINEKINIEISYEIKKPNKKIALRLFFYDKNGNSLFMSSDTTNTKWMTNHRTVGIFKSTCIIPEDFFNNGEIYVNLLINNSGKSWGETYRMQKDNIISFSTEDDMKSSGTRADWTWEWPNVAVRPKLKWDINKIT